MKCLYNLILDTSATANQIPISLTKYPKPMSNGRTPTTQQPKKLKKEKKNDNLFLFPFFRLRPLYSKPIACGFQASVAGNCKSLI